MKHFYYFSLFFFTILAGCNKLPEKIKNTPLYHEVIHHYEVVAPHSEKKEAALFLFQHMSAKYSIYKRGEIDALNLLTDSLKNAKDTLPFDEIKNKLKKLKARSQNDTILMDYDSISSRELIEHIDITYSNWQKLAKISGASFKDYCEYILPYRVLNEPVAELLTKELSSTLDSFVNGITETHTVFDIVNSIVRSDTMILVPELKKNLTSLMSVRHARFFKIVPDCDNATMYKIMVLRSVGIPATYDYLPQWGNHHYSGHSWIAVKWQNKWNGFESFKGDCIMDQYRSLSIPKVFRKSYSNSTAKDEDVTNKYLQVSKIKVKTPFRFILNKPAVAVFNKFQGFKVIDTGKRNVNGFVFENLGRKTVLFPGKMEDKQFVPLASPFYIDSLGTSKYLIPNYDTLISVKLYRKCPLAMGMYDRDKKLSWSRTLSGSWFEASSNNFVTTDTLVKIDSFCSFKEEFYELKSDIPYTAVRYRCSRGTNLASVKFFDRNGNILKGELIHNLYTSQDPNKLFNNDLLDWLWMVDNVTGFQHSYVGYRFNQPTHIARVALLPRNDGNQIVEGDNYELMVWDKAWKSLGVKDATGQFLEYSEIPSGGYYWLKNLSIGTEELPFLISEKGEQFWPGQ